MARIVFDLDGTLIDSAPDIQGIANALMLQEGLNPITLAQTHSFIGNGVTVFLQKLRTLRNIPSSEHERLLALFLARYETATSLTVIYPNVTPALQQLIDAGHSLGICTNKPKSATMAVLEHLSLTPFFSTVFGGDSLAVRKPDPAPLAAAFDALGNGPVIYIGDSDVDAETALRADVPFLFFTEGYCKVRVSELVYTSTFSDFDALPQLVETTLKNTAQ